MNSRGEPSLTSLPRSNHGPKRDALKQARILGPVMASNAGEIVHLTLQDVADIADAHTALMRAIDQPTKRTLEWCARAYGATISRIVIAHGFSPTSQPQMTWDDDQAIGMRVHPEI